MLVGRNASTNFKILKQSSMEASGYIKLIRSAAVDQDSVIEFNIIPGEKTPWHYHKLFAESFVDVAVNIRLIR